MTKFFSTFSHVFFKEFKFHKFCTADAVGIRQW